MNTDLINSLKMMGMGMGAIFLVIIVIYIAVQLMLKLTGSKKDEPDTGRR
ncbi:MAG: OadG family protein [Bacteroidales bacterium]